MTKIIEVKDKTKKNTILTHEQWSHNAEHPEIGDKLEQIRKTLERPDEIITSPEDTSLNYYFKHYKEFRKFLLVAAKYLNRTGFIKTAFYTTKIST